MESFDNYYLITKLGAGTFGTVHLAKDKVTEQIVAIKILHILDENAERQFQREMKILITLRESEFITQVYDFGYYNRLPFFVMEYCNLGSLTNFAGIANAKFAHQVLISVVSTLLDLKQRGGFHRDIKPANILVKRNEYGKIVTKLSDFGLARIEDTISTFTNNPYGSPAYMSPQILEGKSFDEKDDIYSLGVTILELITGSRDKSAVIFGEKGGILERRIESLIKLMTHTERSKRPTLEYVYKLLSRPTTPTIGRTF